LGSALQHYAQLRQADPNYVGLYYHFGKLLEREAQPAEALAVYAQGIAIARQLGDLHALSELNSAKMELEMG
jgi:tetratricopeptide (TPR) repeat protein